MTTLPRPSFPEPVAGAPPAKRLVLVSSRYHAPEAATATLSSLPATVPVKFRGAPLVGVVLQVDRTFALYGAGFSARYLLAFSGRRFIYGFDFGSYARPPRIAVGERELVYERVVWARQADGVLYVEHSHPTYASSSYGRNAYVTAIDLRTKKVRWRSPALVANADTFVLAGDYLVTGYGFTAEPDYLYLLHRRTGRVLERLALPSAPERIALRGHRLHVRTYDHDLVVRIRRG